MSKLLDKLRKTTVQSTSLDESPFFGHSKFVETSMPIINLSFSGKIDGGFVSGLSIFSGESKSFKTLLGLFCMKAYLDKYEDAIGVLYDCEFGVTPDYIKSIGIDPTRILHVPLEHVEQLKFDMAKKLQEIERGERVFFLLDSLGNLASKKEVDDAKDEKSVADMSRAKAIRSWLRTITPHLTTKDIPCFVVNHIYKSIELYSKVVIPGGSAVTYAANQIFVVTKAKEKEGTDLAGHKFTINIEKSRFVKEGIKFPFVVKYDTGIDKYSGLLDFAFATGHVVKSGHRVTRPHVPDDKKWWAKDTSCAEFWDTILEDTDFKAVVEKHVSLGSSKLFQEETQDEQLLLEDDEGE